MFSQRSESGIHWFPESSCPTEHISRILLVTRKSGLYIWQLAIYLRRSGRHRQRTVSNWSLSYRFQSRTPIFLRCCWMSSSKQTETSWKKYSGGYSSHSPVNNIPSPGAGITIFSVQMATSQVANQFSSMAWRLPRVSRPTSSQVTCLFLVWVSKERTWILFASWQTTHPAGSQPI